MMLKTFSILVYTSLAVAELCTVQGPGSAACRTCPAEACANIDPISTANQPLPNRDVDCLWVEGGDVQGKK
jgi:hypothetical protein